MDLNELRARKSDIEALAEQYGVSNIRVFGSVARGDQRDDSDIDLLATLPKNISLLDRAHISNAFCDLLAHDVDLVSDRSVSKYIKDDIFNEAIPL
ncbi:MAG: nucleotidyltransferase domain-containing protein [Saprospiraceae bacterium]